MLAFRRNERLRATCFVLMDRASTVSATCTAASVPVVVKQRSCLVGTTLRSTADRRPVVVSRHGVGHPTRVRRVARQTATQIRSAFLVNRVLRHWCYVVCSAMSVPYIRTCPGTLPVAVPVVFAPHRRRDPVRSTRVSGGLVVRRMLSVGDVDVVWLSCWRGVGPGSARVAHGPWRLACLS